MTTEDMTSQARAAAILSILTLPDPRLRKPADWVPAGPVSADLRLLAASMFATMWVTNRGVGLSANQIGRPERLAVVDIALDAGPRRRFTAVMFNLTITGYSHQTKHLNEGCLSIPDRHFRLRRSLEVEFEYMDADGVWHRNGKAGGNAAQAIQHECDHLDGYLISAPRRTQDSRGGKKNVAS